MDLVDTWVKVIFVASLVSASPIPINDLEVKVTHCLRIS